MRRKTFGRAGALAALTAALCLAQGGVLAAEASAQTYDLAEGSVTVKAEEGVQYVTQDGGVSNEPQTDDIVITQTGSGTASTTNTITIEAESGQTARVALSGVNIDVRGGGPGNFGVAAISVSGAGSATVELSGQNTARSGYGHAGLEKSSTGNLTITAHDDDQGLTATGGDYGAGIGGGYNGKGADIVISGGEVSATGVGGAAGIGCGFGKTGCSGVEVSGAAQLKVQGGQHKNFTGAGIGDGMHAVGEGSSISEYVDGDEVVPDTSELTVCGRIEYYAAGADMETSNPNPIVTGTGGSHIISHQMQEPTCTKAGYLYVACSRCDYTTYTELPATGRHKFTAEKAEAAYLKSAATCTEKAVYYTSCPMCGLSSKGADDEATFVSGGPLGHDWGEATYAWSEDHLACTATRTCGRSADHTETEAVEATEAVTQKRTCTDDELTTYTATFENGAFETQTAKDVKTADATGHDFTAEVAEAAYLKSAATCTEKAVYYTSCSVCGESSKGTDKEATFEAGDPLDHDWGEAVYTWSKDHSSCTATRTCRNDTSHEETETVDAVATVTQPLSCTDDELTTYTAEFENEAFAAQTVEGVKTASATGHDFTAKKAEDEHLASAATCTERALYYKSCAACGESSKGTDGEATFETGERDTTNHEHLTHVAAKKATTKAEGNTEYWYCKDCKRYFSDAAGTKEISKADTVIAKKGEPAKKEKEPAIPATGDGAMAQTAALLTTGIAAIGAALLAKRRTA